MQPPLLLSVQRIYLLLNLLFFILLIEELPGVLIGFPCFCFFIKGPVDVADMIMQIRVLRQQFQRLAKFSAGAFEVAHLEVDPAETVLNIAVAGFQFHGAGDIGERLLEIAVGVCPE